MPVRGRRLYFGAEVFLVLPFVELAICFPESVMWIWFEVVYMTDYDFTFVVFSFLFLFCMHESYVSNLRLDYGIGEAD